MYFSFKGQVMQGFKFSVGVKNGPWTYTGAALSFPVVVALCS